ncbi:hypothetical protein [Pseudomonas viridiflava]|uniref:hypothetical protein n=1 Tax=Pseudomonas viridiflava TaxID=33069 RepID=UPI000F01AFBD|nr:hypothetical protein [Pseudomonas viridiflava]
MTEKNPDRLLVPDNKVIVVLDTAPVRELAYAEETPPWVETFAQMAREGYSFSLADGALSELLAQRHRNALSATDCLKILERLERFLSPELPVMLGKRDLSGMLQINEDPWDAQECLELSQYALELLKQCAHPADKQQSPEWVLQEERDDWVGLFAGWQKILDEINAEDPSEPIDVNLLTSGMLDQMARHQDEWSSLVPAMSVRNHLKNRYMWRQFVRKQKRKNGYDPTSSKKRNDGIDADLYLYLILPALIVTTDGGFFRGLADIESFQKGWFFEAQVLANEWSRGARPAPTWP